MDVYVCSSSQGESQTFDGDFPVMGTGGFTHGSRAHVIRQLQKEGWEPRLADERHSAQEELIRCSERVETCMIWALSSLMSLEAMR